nr:putative ribonuclease H-like domain-containing protein [Tanacetum cinerariifolium]
GHTQEEGIDYEEVFALVAWIKAIRFFLDYASFMGFMVYQMDVKSDFLYGAIKEEFYVFHHAGFEDPDYPDKVYVDDIIFYSTNKELCKAFEKLMKDKFQMSSMGELTFFLGLQTLFIKKQKGDILLVQVYVDNIIFGSTNKELCIAFKKLMKDKFQMSYVRELTFILGLQVKQKTDGIFSSQDKYVAKILRKFGFIDVKSASTHTETEKPLLKDSNGEDVDIHLYMLMIRSLIYLTSFRPDIMFAVCAYARFQVTPKLSHLHAVKRIFRYLKGKTHLGLWYPRDSPFNMVAYSDSDYAGASLDRNSTTKGCQFLVNFARHFITAVSYELMLFGLMEVAAVNLMMLVEKVNDDVQLQALIDDKKVVVTKAIIRRHLHLDDADGVLANMRRVRKGFSGVATPLFDSMLVPSQQAKEDVEVPITHAQPSITSASSPIELQYTTPTPHDTPPQYQPPTPPTLPLPDQLTAPHDSPMLLLSTLREIYMHPNKRKIAAIDADEGITLVDVETDEEEVAMDVKSQGRTNVNVASKGVSVVSAPELVSTAEPTVFDDEDVTMTMAQSLIKLKAEKAIIFDENIA